MCCPDLLVGTREKKFPARHSGNSPTKENIPKLFLHTSSVIKSQNMQCSQGQKGPSHQRKLVSESISYVVIIKNGRAGKIKCFKPPLKVFLWCLACLQHYSTTATRATTVAVPGTPGTSDMMSQRKKSNHRHTDVRPSDRSNS